DWRKLGLAACALVPIYTRFTACRMSEGVAPLPPLAHQWAASYRTAGACRRRLLALHQTRNHALVHPRLGQSNRHGNGEQRYRKSLQHDLFLPKVMCANFMPADIYNGTIHVRFGSLADMAACPINVCFTPQSRHRLSALACPLSAKNRHR